MIKETEIIAEIAKENAKEVYSDLIKPGASSIGNSLGIICGFFESVILYPLQKTNIKFKYKLAEFSSSLEEKVKNISEEKLQESPMNIMRPTLEALKYNIDEENIREMFLNLLANSMNKDNVNKCHISYVEIVKNLISLDAEILKKIGEETKITLLKIEFKFGRMSYISAMPTYFAFEIQIPEDNFLISKSIINLQRLGLIDINKAILKDKKILKENSFIQERYNIYKNIKSNIHKTEEELIIKHEAFILELNDFGKGLLDVCL